MLVFATSMSPVAGWLAYPSDGFVVLPQGRAPAIQPLTPPPTLIGLSSPFPFLLCMRIRMMILQPLLLFSIQPLSTYMGSYIHTRSVLLILPFERGWGGPATTQICNMYTMQSSTNQLLNLAAQEGFTRVMSMANMSTTTEKVTSRGNSTSGAPPWCPVLEKDSEVIAISFLSHHPALPGVGSDGPPGTLGRAAKDERAG